MGSEGLEPERPTTCGDSNLRHPTDGGAAECGASGGDSTPIDPDLALVTERWEHLSADLRAGIVAMVRAAQ